MKKIITFILAGGVGSRLGPLTVSRSKPAVPFGGKYRIIDFMMSNCLNSGLFKIMVLVQYRAQGLIDHLQDHWSSQPRFGYFVHTVPPQQMFGTEWYRGTADAVYQNLPIAIRRNNVDTAAILSGDHILAMDFEQMYEYHCDKHSAFTVCALSVPSERAAGQFGVIEVESGMRIVGFEEKPAMPKEIPGKPGWCLISTGNYFANIPHLRQALEENTADPHTSHDFGKDIIPKMVREGAAVYAYDFRDNKIPGQEEHYWRDVGTIQSYFDANMDLVSITPELNVYNEEWPILTPADNLPMAKFTETSEHGCLARSSALSGGCIVEDSKLYKAVIGRKTRVYNSVIEESVLFSEINVGHRSYLRRVIVDRGVSIPPGTIIGIDQEADRARGLYVDESGITVVPRHFTF